MTITIRVATCQALVLGAFALATATSPAVAGAAPAKWPAVAGAYQRPGINDRASVASDGTQQNCGANCSSGFDISANGRFVAFSSVASNLVPGDTNRASPPDSYWDGDDIFVHDRLSGTTERVSVNSDGSQMDGDYGNPSISDDGRYVAFQEFTTSLSEGEHTQVYVRDRWAGSTQIVSVSSDGTPGNRGSGVPALSADGRFVAFTSQATNLVAGDSNGAQDVFVRDRAMGTTELVSMASDGTIGNANSYAPPSISADGRFVAFDSAATNLAPGDTNAAADVFVRDRASATTERVSVATDGRELKGGASGGNDVISADGRFVVFTSADLSLAPTDTGGTEEVFVRDRQTRTTERVSVASDGSELMSQPKRDSNNKSTTAIPTISPDGRFVAFEFFLDQDETDQDVSPGTGLLLYDRLTKTTERALIAADGSDPDWYLSSNGLQWAALSRGGRHVVFSSNATNLVAGDTNRVAGNNYSGTDVFVRDRGPVTGLGGLTVEAGASKQTAKGWATFSGATVASAVDSQNDGDDGAGAEITSASIINRPEQQDLLVQIHMASLPSTVRNPPEADETLCTTKEPAQGQPLTFWIGLAIDYAWVAQEHGVPLPEKPAVADCLTRSYGGVPGTVYRLRFHVAQTTYEVRALPWDTTTDPPTPARVALYRCAPDCSEIKQLGGGVGTTGPEVLASVRLDDLGLGGPADLTQLEASVTRPNGSEADTLTLPDAHVEAPQVKLGVASPSTPEDQVQFTTAADLSDGRFSAPLPTSTASGPQRLWARACLGDICGVDSLELASP